jgi:peptidoglycan/xylan/chitin deacetylase (PgdA/CDA1 family)
MSVPRFLARTLLYHDVVLDDRSGTSGFAGPDADVYKLSAAEFTDHLDNLRAAGFSPSTIGGRAEPEHMLTFDDGGQSAIDLIAPALERHGWRGHFLVTTGCIGTEGFLDVQGIRALHTRGHVVGAHSATHPLAMATLSESELAREWRLSVAHLTEILGMPPAVASIPGGWYSRQVAQSAAAAGLRYLFTSEPTSRAWRVGPVLCLGRYTIWRGMPPAAAVALATGRGLWPLRQRLSWTSKKAAKHFLGPSYTSLRRRLFAGLDGVRVRSGTRL